MSCNLSLSLLLQEVTVGRNIEKISRVETLSQWPEVKNSTRPVKSKTCGRIPAAVHVACSPVWDTCISHPGPSGTSLQVIRAGVSDSSWTNRAKVTTLVSWTS